MKPSLQLQEYEPGMFLHTCWQPALLSRHSLISKKINKTYACVTKSTKCVLFTKFFLAANSYICIHHVSYGQTQVVYFSGGRFNIVQNYGWYNYNGCYLSCTMNPLAWLRVAIICGSPIASCLYLRWFSTCLLILILPTHSHCAGLKIVNTFKNQARKNFRGIL